MQVDVVVQGQDGAEPTDSKLRYTLPQHQNKDPGAVEV